MVIFKNFYPPSQKTTGVSPWRLHKKFSPIFSCGFGLIEIIVAVSIIGFSFFSLSGIAQLAYRIAIDSGLKRQAYFLAIENLEVARILRDSSWGANIASKGTHTIYYPVFNASTAIWGLSSTTPTIIDGAFTQQILFEHVYRRTSDGDIVASTSLDVKYLDYGTKEIVSRVTWNSGESRIELHTYLSNSFSN